MKKMRLDLELLAVDSFDVAPRGGAGAGTVFGRDSWTEPQEPDTLANTCGCATAACTAQTGCGQATCGYSCGGGCPTAATCGEYTCNHTCPDSCYVCGPQEPR